MTAIERDVIESVMWDADIDSAKALYESYSGRGMYGAKCFGIVGSMEDYGKFLVQLTKTDIDLAWELAQNVRMDSMAFDTIFYFPGFQLAEEDDE